MSLLLSNSIRFTVCAMTRNVKNTLPNSNASLKCLQNNYCSKPPEKNEVNVKKPLTAKALSSRWQRRSLNPSDRVMTMLASEDQETVKQSESKLENPKDPDQILVPKFKPKRKRNMLRSLGDMPRVMSMLDKEDKDK